MLASQYMTPCVSVGGGEPPSSGQGSGGEAGDAADQALGG